MESQAESAAQKNTVHKQIADGQEIHPKNEHTGEGEGESREQEEKKAPENGGITQQL